MDVIYKCRRNEVLLHSKSSLSVQCMYQIVAESEGLKCHDFYLTCNGRLLQSHDSISNSCIITSHLRVHGGKGGFGSMLRAIGARIEKTTNHEACRDLSGRRMRDMNNEKHIAEWLKNQEDEKQERIRKRQEKLERILHPKHTYEDKDYTSNLQENAERIDEALKSALQNRKERAGDKRKLDTDNGREKKKSRMWLAVEHEGDSDDNDNPENIISATEISPSSNAEEVVKEMKPVDDRTEKKKENRIENENRLVSVKKSENNNSVEMKMENRNLTEQKNDIGKLASKTMGGIEANMKVELQNPSNVVDTKPVPVDLNEYNSAEHLEELGLDRLKSELMSIGLKCGGTLQERAQRLYLTKNTPLDKLHPSLFAKSSKRKSKPNK